MKDDYDPWDIWQDIEKERIAKHQPPKEEQKPKRKYYPKRRGPKVLMSKAWLCKKRKEKEYALNKVGGKSP